MSSEVKQSDEKNGVVLEKNNPLTPINYAKNKKRNFGNIYNDEIYNRPQQQIINMKQFKETSQNSQSI